MKAVSKNVYIDGLNNVVGKYNIVDKYNTKNTAWKSNGLSDQSIKLPLAYDNNLNPGMNCIDNIRN